MSNYVVIARFDDSTNVKIMDLQKTLTEAGYSVQQWPPHITIAAYENFDEKLICDWTEQFCKTHYKLNVGLNSLSILPPGGEHSDTAVVCLAPAHSKAFVDFYYDFHAKHEEYCTGIGWFNSISHGNPSIHSTIGVVNINEMQETMKLIFQSGIFGEVEIVALEVYTYPMRLIHRYELK